MEKLDADLRSIQEVRNLVRAAKAAQAEYGQFSQEKIDAVVRAVAEACAAEAAPLARKACEETGFGNAEDKRLKNLLGSVMTYEYIRDMKTVGFLREDPGSGIWEIGVPMGVVAAIIPSTNPTSTVMYKALISLKSGNGVVFSPHPGARQCILDTVAVVQKAARQAGAPEGLIGVISEPTLEASQTLMKHRDVAIILATGGEAMVRAAYSSGNPALGVGPGNGPSYIEKSADIPKAVKRIFDSKTFDNGTICASEQSIVTESCIRDRVMEEVRRQGGYFLDPEESRKVSAFLLRSNGTMNPKIVGKTAEKIASMAGIRIPEGTRVLLSEQTEVSKENPYSREKLCPVLGFYVEPDWQHACAKCIAILRNEGVGHTMTIHSEDRSIIREFALKKPVNRLLVNTPGALGGVGVTTKLPPALTLGCGAVGKSATSDNVGPMNLINIRRVAFGAVELDDVRAANGGSPARMPAAHGPEPTGTRAADRYQVSAADRLAAKYARSSAPTAEPAGKAGSGVLSGDQVAAITQAVLKRLGNGSAG